MGVVVALLLVAIAWFGHAFLLTMKLNVWFSTPLPRWFLKRVRAATALAVFLFPPVLSWIYGHELLAAWSDPGVLTDQPLVFAYLSICWFTTLVYLPIVSVVRSRRRSPDQVASRRGEIEDVAKHLGEAPIGNGKYWRLARLPRNQCFHVECRDLTLRLPRLPEALNGLTILHVTDLHFCGSPAREYYQRVFDLCLAAGPPDILAITGDVVDSSSSQMDRAAHRPAQMADRGVRHPGKSRSLPRAGFGPPPVAAHRRSRSRQRLARN